MKIGKALLLALGLSAVGTAALADWHGHGGYYWHHHHYHHRYSCHHHWCYR
jgi:hypothetical protein